MQNFLFSLNVTLPIFIIIVVGGFLKRIGLLNDGFCAVADKFVFKVALPVQLFQDIAAMDIRADFSGKFVVFCMIATTCMFAATWILGAVFLKDKSMVGAFAQAAARGSAAILGIAFVENIYGDSGMTPMMIVAAVPLFNIYSVIILTVTSSEGKFNGALVKKLLVGVVTNPIILGIAAGMVWSLLGLPMPTMAGKTLSSIASLTSPLALLAIGAGFKGRKALGYLRPTAVATAVKLMALPALFLPVAVHLGFTDEKLVALLVMLGSIATPSCYVMAKNMGHEGVVSSSVVMLTTMCSAFTLTGWLFIMKCFGLV